MDQKECGSNDFFKEQMKLSSICLETPKKEKFYQEQLALSNQTIGEEKLMEVERTKVYFRYISFICSFSYFHYYFLH